MTITIEDSKKDGFIKRQDNSMDELRDILFLQLNKVVNGKANSFEVGATVALSHEIINSVDKEIQYNRFASENFKPVTLPKFNLVGIERIGG